MSQCSDDRPAIIIFTFIILLAVSIVIDPNVCRKIFKFFWLTLFSFMRSFSVNIAASSITSEVWPSEISSKFLNQIYRYPGFLELKINVLNVMLLLYEKKVYFH